MLVLILDHKIRSSRSFTRWTRVATFLVTTGWQLSGFVIAYSLEFDKIFTRGEWVSLGVYLDSSAHNHWHYVGSNFILVDSCLLCISTGFSPFDQVLVALEVHACNVGRLLGWRVFVLVWLGAQLPVYLCDGLGSPDFRQASFRFRVRFLRA